MSHPAVSLDELQSSWKTISRRLALAGSAVRQEFANATTAARLLFHGWNNGIVFRQKSLNGFQMIVRVDEEVGRSIYFKAVHERAETNYFRTIVRPSSVCFDIGANIGYYSLLFASLCPKGSVHSFEPVPLNYHVLSANCLINGFSHVTTTPFAVGDRDDLVDFVISSDSAYSSLVDTGRKKVAAKVSVPITTLDAYCAKNNISRVDLLKVDVEGAEEKVLLGANRLLRDRFRRPHFVMLELYQPMLQRYGSDTGEIVARMTSMGYHPYVLWKGRTVPFRVEQLTQLHNVVFVDE
jgi:FkbM family methyltransferase